MVGRQELTWLTHALLAAGLLGCGDDPVPASEQPVADAGNSTIGTAMRVPMFSLSDLNETSPRAGEVVSPRDYLQRVSGWYFTHSD